MPKETLIVCERCLMAIESREGVQGTIKRHIDEDSNDECDWCGECDNGVLYELLKDGSFQNGEIRPIPCPFCGGEPRIEEESCIEYFRIVHNCEFGDKMHIHTRFYPTKQEVIEAWNRRV